jgi:hypothetical protein
MPKPVTKSGRAAGSGVELPSPPRPRVVGIMVPETDSFPQVIAQYNPMLPLPKRLSALRMVYVIEPSTLPSGKSGDVGPLSGVT